MERACRLLSRASIWELTLDLCLLISEVKGQDWMVRTDTHVRCSLCLFLKEEDIYFMLWFLLHVEVLQI